MEATQRVVICERNTTVRELVSWLLESHGLEVFQVTDENSLEPDLEYQLLILDVSSYNTEGVVEFFSKLKGLPQKILFTSLIPPNSKHLFQLLVTQESKGSFYLHSKEESLLKIPCDTLQKPFTPYNILKKSLRLSCLKKYQHWVDLGSPIVPTLDDAIPIDMELEAPDENSSPINLANELVINQLASSLNNCFEDLLTLDPRARLERFKNIIREQFFAS